MSILFGTFDSWVKRRGKLALGVSLFFFLLAPLFTYAQNDLASSEGTSTYPVQDTNVINILNRTAQEELNAERHEQAIEHAQNALALSEKLSYTFGRAKATFVLGKANQKMNRYTTSLKYYLEAASHYQNLKNDQKLAETNIEIGLLHQSQKNHEKAIEYLRNAYDMVNKLQDEQGKFFSLKGLALSYYQLEDYPNAARYYKAILPFDPIQNNLEDKIRVLERLSEISLNQKKYKEAITYNEEIIEVNRKLNDARSIARALNNTGYIYKQQGEINTSLRYFRQALDLNKNLYAENINSDLRKKDAIYSINVGVAYSNLEDYRNAKKYFLEALEIRKAQKDEQGIAQANNYLAANFLKSGNQEQALEYAFKSIKIAEKINDKNSLRSSYRILSEIYQKVGHYQNAQKYYKAYIELTNELNQTQQEQEQAFLQNQIEISRKESEIKLLLADREKKDLALRQLELEAAQKEKDLALKAKELALLRRNQELQAAEIRNQQLEKERVKQLLTITQKEAEAAQQKQAIALLEKNKKIQDLALKQKEAAEKERQRTIELLQKDQELKQVQLEEEARYRRFGIIFLGLLGLIFVMLIVGFLLNRRKNKKLAFQNLEIINQKAVLENINQKLQANEEVLKKSYTKLKSKEQQIRQKNEELQASEEELRQNMEELEASKEEIQAQKETLESAFKEIEKKNLAFMQSVKYAKKIQQAILPSFFQFRQIFSDHFVVFMPKDVVSGDFYWMTKVGRKSFVACVDCTGHGVPGAFMSLIGNSLLNQIVNEKKVTEANKILEVLNVDIQKSLKQKERNNIDGMDLSVCSFEKWEDDLYSLQFSGAKTSVFYYSKGKLNELKGDRQAVGGWQKEPYRKFTKQVVELKKGDIIYMMTDGYIDAPNAKRKKFGKKRLKELLYQEAERPMMEQKETLLQALQDHHSGSLQRDDITVIGLRI